MHIVKHLVQKEHHPHLKKRAILELVGLLILIVVSYDQRELIGTSFSALRTSDTLLLVLLLFTYWAILPLTSISYRLLSPKSIPLTTTMLAQVAAAGPGRIIPGGLGHLSIAAMHLKKSGLKLQQAIVITIANNVIGLIVNSGIVITAILFHPTLIDTIRDNVSTQNLLFAAFGVLSFFGLIEWLAHLRGTRKTIRKINKEWGNLIVHLLSNPDRLLLLIIIAAVVSAGHMAMLMLSGAALSVGINAADAFIALSVGVLMGGAVPTPGGLGAVEAGLITALVVLGYSSSDAVSVALLYRTATYWQPLIPGILSYLYLRERKLL